MFLYYPILRSLHLLARRRRWTFLQIWIFKHRLILTLALSHALYTMGYTHRGLFFYGKFTIKVHIFKALILTTYIFIYALSIYWVLLLLLLLLFFLRSTGNHVKFNVISIFLLHFALSFACILYFSFIYWTFRWVWYVYYCFNPLPSNETIPLASSRYSMNSS